MRVNLQNQIRFNSFTTTNYYRLGRSLRGGYIQRNKVFINWFKLNNLRFMNLLRNRTNLKLIKLPINSNGSRRSYCIKFDLMKMQTPKPLKRSYKLKYCFINTDNKEVSSKKVSSKKVFLRKKRYIRLYSTNKLLLRAVVLVLKIS